MTATTTRTHTVETARRMPGVEGFWVLIAGDLGVFTLLFGSFMAARSDALREFEHARHALDVTHGGLNTLLLLTSSWCVARALQSARRGDPVALRWLRFGIAGGAAFAASKVVEYAVEVHAGHTPTSGDFFMYYFAVTGIHLFHVLVGCVVLSVFLSRWRSRGLPTQFAGFESAACFWHMVDLLWVLIFPLLYLTR